ncbi:MAG: putative Ig domain-containing protein [Nodosilinea sp.]
MAASVWDSLVSSVWDISTNWSDDTLPTSLDDVLIDVDGTITITHRIGSTTINSLTSEENLTVAGGALAISAASTISQNLTILSGTLNANGEVIITGANSLWTGGTIDGDAGLTNQGTLTIDTTSGKNLLGLLTNEGTIVHQIGNIFLNNGTLENTSGGVYEFQSGTVANSTGTNNFNNSGTVQKTTDATAIINVAFNNMGGTVEVEQGLLQFTRGYNQTSGVLRLNGGILSSSSVLGINGGLITGFGTIKAGISGTAMIDPGLGTIDPSLAIGDLEIGGNHTLGENSLVYLEIGGTDEADYDQLDVKGRFTADGTLAIRFTNGFTPQAGDAFSLIKYFGLFAGGFDDIELPDLSDQGLQLSFNNGVLVVAEITDSPTGNSPLRYEIVESDDIEDAEFIPRDQLLTEKKVILTSPRVDVQGESPNATEIIGNNFYNDGSDVDIFGVELKGSVTDENGVVTQRADQLTIDIDALDNDGNGAFAGSNLNSTIRVFRANGTEVINAVEYFNTDPDSGEISGDPYAILTAPSDGIYYIGVSAQGNDNYNPNIADKNSPGSGKVDPGGAASQGVFQLELTLAADDPIGKNPIESQVAYEDQPFTFVLPEDAFFDDEAEANLVLSAELADGTQLSELVWLSFDPATRTFSGTPTNDHIGILRITVTAQDTSESFEETVSDTFTLKVNGTNDVPRVANPIERQNAKENGD